MENSYFAFECSRYFFFYFFIYLFSFSFAFFFWWLKFHIIFFAVLNFDYDDWLQIQFVKCYRWWWWWQIEHSIFDDQQNTHKKSLANLLYMLFVHHHIHPYMGNLSLIATHRKKIQYSCCFHIRLSYGRWSVRIKKSNRKSTPAKKNDHSMDGWKKKLEMTLLSQMTNNIPESSCNR